MFGRIDHIGVAVEDLDAAIELYRDRFAMREQHRETVEDFGVEAVLLDVGDGHVELLRPLSEETGVGRFLSRGVRLLDEEPRRGVRDSRVAFLHPKATGGVLTELVEAAHP